MELSLHVKSVRVSSFDESNSNHISIEVTDDFGSVMELSFYKLPLRDTRAIRSLYSDADTRNFEATRLASEAAAQELTDVSQDMGLE